MHIAKIYAWVEHIFVDIEQMGGKLIHTVGQVRTNFAMFIMIVSYSFKRLVYFRLARTRSLTFIAG